MRKFIGLFLIVGSLLPISAMAYSVKVDIYSPWGSGYSQVHGHTSVKNLSGSLFGDFDSTLGRFSNLSGNILGVWGKVSVTDGHFNNDGSGKLAASVFSLNPNQGGFWDYSGEFNFFDSSAVDTINPYIYDNVATSSYIKVWGGGKFDSSKLTWSGWQGKGSKWLGADLYGKVVKLPEPGAILLLLAGLIGFGLYMSMQKILTPGKKVAY